MPLNSIEELLTDFRQGRMVIVMDDEDRENEGDLVMAAQFVTAEDINFMARFGRGLICLTLSEVQCRKLKLPLMVAENGAALSTNFTVSIEAATGVTTGISAADRATTIRAAVAQDAKPEDIVSPGHVFPLMAQPGGVLTRSGHTEAGCDLARLSGLKEAAVIVEILNDDGTMARRPDLEKFAAEHNLKIGTIADLITYRVMTEKTIERAAHFDLSTDYGNFSVIAYRDVIDDTVHMAMIKGKVDPLSPCLVRVCVEDPINDLLAGNRDGSGWSVAKAMQRIQQENEGVVVVLRKPPGPRDLITRMKGFERQDKNQESVVREQVHDPRLYGLGAQIIADIGIKKMRVLGAPRKMSGLSGFGLEVTEYITR